MVSAALADALAAPTDVLRALYRAADDVDVFPTSVSAHFAQVFQAEDAFRQIPALNVQNPPEIFPDRSLVAFRAMIQDTSPSPEIYLAKGPGGACGGWGIANDALQADYADLRECTIFWAVSVPGESSWCVQETASLYQSQNASNASHAPTRSHKYPLSGSPHIGAQVKIYDPQHAAGLKTCDLCTFIGILTQEPVHGDLESSEVEAVPTLHVVFTRKIPPTIVPRNYPTPSQPLDIRDTRDKLLTWIADEALSGDKIAAEWALLAAISRTQSRSPGICPLSLTLSAFPSPSDTSSVPTLYHVLSLILPLVDLLPLTLDTLNTTSFCPESKDEDLHSGWLQVPQGSVYLITEAGITEGNVLEKGVQNLQALQNMIAGQTLDYVFPFSRFTFATDVSFLVLTSGNKSAFFQTSVNVRLNQECQQKRDLYKPPGEVRLPSDDTLAYWRKLVGGSKVGTAVINDDTAQYIQDDFVKERKASLSTSGGDKNEPGITSDDLIHRMVTARLLALSHHEPFVTSDTWEKTKALEASRKARMA